MKISKQGYEIGILGAILVVSIALAYVNTFSVPFIFDDAFTIVDNLSIRHLWPPWSPFTDIPMDLGLVSRPIVNFSLAVNYAISGEAVWSYHAFNLIVHVLAALALLGVLRRTLVALGTSLEGGLLFSFSCALLWGLHPLQTQAVTYVIQRCESLMALFFLLTFYCAIRGWRSEHPGLWHLLAFLSFLLAAGSKEVAVVAPFLLLLYEWVFMRTSPARAVIKSPALYTGLFFGCVLMVAVSLNGGTFVATTGQISFSPVDYWVTQCRVVIHYLRLVFWPSGLVLDYGWPLTTFRETWPVVLMVLALIALVIRAVLRRDPAGFLAAWFFLILAPTSFIPLADAAVEHRMYLPSAAIIILALGAAVRLSAFAVKRLPPMAPFRPTVGSVAGLLVVSCLAATFGLLTYERNKDYLSTLSIWSDTVVKRPGNFRGYHGLGLALSQQGRPDLGLACLQRSVRLRPRNAYVNNDVGFILLKLNRPEEAIPYFREAIRIKSQHYKAYNNLGAALAQTKQYGEAVSCFSAALRIKPDYAAARNNLRMAVSNAAGGNP